ncbi:MAG: DcaP family trimeric outer membrane transporter [Chitinophagales bacterium]
MKLSTLLFVLLMSVNAYTQSLFADTTKNTKTSNDAQPKQLSMEIYGFILTDAIYDFGQMDPKWFDVPRPTKLPSYKDQFEPDGQIYFSIRETRFGVRGYTHTPIGVLNTWFEFDLFGSGVDAGQTTFHLRHAYGELGKFGVGQTWSPFVDIDVFPNDLDYWGPNGMANIRNIQIRYMPIQGDSKLTIALEKPGATADEGAYRDQLDLVNVKPHFTLPNLTAEYRYATAWGYVELAGLLGQLKWQDLDTLGTNISGKRTAWGFNLSSRIKVFQNDLVHLQLLYGQGIESYVRDAPSDVAIKNYGASPFEAVALPVTGFVGFYDHFWNDKFSSTVGYSFVKISNSNGQAPNAFRMGTYAITNLIYTPHKDVMLELQLQYLNRKNFSDGWSASDPRIQFSFRFNFSQKFYHEINTTK